MKCTFSKSAQFLKKKKKKRIQISGLDFCHVSEMPEFQDVLLAPLF